MPEQLDIFGQGHDWQDTTPKAQEKKSKPLIRQDKQDATDQEILGWMKRLEYSVSLDELADRLKPVGYTAGAVGASMKRLRKQHLIVSDGDEDLNCPDYQVLSNYRWRAIGIMEDNY